MASLRPQKRKSELPIPEGLQSAGLITFASAPQQLPILMTKMMSRFRYLFLASESFLFLDLNYLKSERSGD